MAEKPLLRAYEKYTEKLVKCLPMDDTLFLTKLSAYKLLPGDTSDKLNALHTQADKASYFLSHVIKPALDIGDISSFDSLLSVMKQCDYVHVEKLAFEIKSDMSKASDIGPGTSSVTAGRKRGKTDEVILSDEGIESHDLDRDGDVMPPPPKKIHVTITETNETQEQITARNLEYYKRKFTKNDIENSFVFMLDKLELLWCNVEFTRLKSTCTRDGRLTNELKTKLGSTNNLREIFDLLSNTPFCTWLDTRLLKSMADVADIPEAIQMITTFEECVYNRKCSEVTKYFKKQYINPDHLTVVTAKLNKYAERFVAKLIEDCQNLESVLYLPSDSSTLVGSETGCLELCLVIPKYCHLHAYESLKKHFYKLRPLNIQYLQIGTLPKVYTTNLTKEIEAKSLLTEMSSHDNWEYPSQVIDHYYTYLEGHMGTDSVSHMMHSEQLINDSDYETITAAPNDININRLLLQYVRTMDMTNLLRFCDLLKSMETHQCIGETLETSLKSTEYDEDAVSKSEYGTLIPSRLMTSQFKEVNTIFLGVIDKLVTQLRTVDIEFLADKCRTLMASDIHNIKLFTDSFIKKLFKCSHLSLLKIYLLPFITWLDNSILIELAAAYEKVSVLELFCKYTHIIDDTEPITSYPIPTFSQLIIPLDDSEYTIVAVKLFQNCNGLILKDVKDVKELLTSHWELTAHALHLAAIDYPFNFMYWMIPKQVQYLVENRLNQGQNELWNKGIFHIFLLSKDFFSANDHYTQQVINGPFNVYRVSLKDSLKEWQADMTVHTVEQKMIHDLKVHTNVLQDEILKSKLHLEAKQKQLDNSEDVKIFTNLQEECSGLKSQLQKQVSHANKLKKENSKLATRLRARLKIKKNMEDLKVRANTLEEENSELKSQVKVTREQLRNSEIEKKHYVDKYTELKDKERCDVAIQTDMISGVAQKKHTLAYEKYAKKLTECLPMDDTVFTAKLSNCDLLSKETSDQLKALSIPVAKASYLLDHVIKPTLDIGATFIFDNLLSVMEHCGYAHVEKLAHEIKSEIHEGYDIKSDMRLVSGMQ